MPFTAVDEAWFPAKSLPETTSEYALPSKSPIEEPVNVLDLFPAVDAVAREAETTDPEASVKFAKSVAPLIDSERE